MAAIARRPEVAPLDFEWLVELHRKALREQKWMLCALGVILVAVAIMLGALLDVAIVLWRAHQ